MFGAGMVTAAAERAAPKVRAAVTRYREQAGEEMENSLGKDDLWASGPLFKEASFNGMATEDIGAETLGPVTNGVIGTPVAVGL